MPQHGLVFKRVNLLRARRVFLPLLAATGLALLSGCAGGGGSQGGVVTPPPAPPTGLSTLVEVMTDTPVGARQASTLFGTPAGLRATLAPLVNTGAAFSTSLAGVTFTGQSATVNLPGETLLVSVRLGQQVNSAVVRLPGVAGQRLRLWAAAENGVDFNQDGDSQDLLIRAVSFVDTAADGVSDNLFLFERLYSGAVNTRSAAGIRFMDLNGDGVLNAAQGELVMADQDNDGAADPTDSDDDNDGFLDPEDNDDDNDGVADGSDTTDTDNDNDGVLNFTDPDFTDGLIPSAGGASLNSARQLVQSAFYFRSQIPADLDRFTNAHQMMGALSDIYSSYLTAPDMTALTQGLSGQVSGVGVQLENNPTGGTRIKALVAGGPAATAGVLAGDVLLGVGGMDTSRVTPTEASGLLRGPQNSSVLLTLGRSSQRLNFVLSRATLLFNPVSVSRPAATVLQVTLSAFDTGSAGQVKAAIDAEAGLTGLILDLQGNPGGLVDEAVTLADYFLSGGNIVTLAPFGAASTISTASNQASDITLPLAVLTDPNSASASEIFAAAIKENNRGNVVGQITFGKGIVQYIYTFSGGDGLKLTAAGYLTPLGNNIHGVGVSPTHPVSTGADPVAVALGLLGAN